MNFLCHKQQPALLDMNPLNGLHSLSPGTGQVPTGVWIAW